VSSTYLYHSNWESDRDLFSFVFRSSALHVFFVLILWALSFILSMEFRAQREANIVLVEGSVRVDVVAMPRHTLRELQTLQQMASGSTQAPRVVTPAKAQEVAPAPVVADNSKAPVIEVEAEPQESIMDVLKRRAQQKIEPSAAPKQQAQAPAAAPGLSAAEQQRLRQLVAAGNRISEGASLTGGGSGAEMTAFNRYISAIPDQVRVHWRLPSFLADQDLRARVRIYLKSNGELMRTEIFESSGNADYDRRAVEAIRLAQPFPALAEEYAARAARGDIVLGFPL
jgi:colicin import membrane protein